MLVGSITAIVDVLPGVAETVGEIMEAGEGVVVVARFGVIVKSALGLGEGVRFFDRGSSIAETGTPFFCSIWSCIAWFC